MLARLMYVSVGTECWRTMMGGWIYGNTIVMKKYRVHSVSV